MLRTYAPPRRRRVLRVVRRPARRSRRRRARRSRRRRAVRSGRRRRDASARAWVLSSATGKELHHWTGHRSPRRLRRGRGGGRRSRRRRQAARSRSRRPRTDDQTRTLPGRGPHLLRRDRARSSGTGRARQPGELFGRMVVAAGDLDGDGVDDLAIGAPWHRRDAGDRVGRVELRSGRSGDGPGASSSATSADCWFGWHIRRAPDPDGRGRPALLIGSLRHPVDGKRGRRRARPLRAAPRAAARGDQGTIDARRAPQRHQVDAQRALAPRSGSAANAARAAAPSPSWPAIA